jgi:hypothetical protein
MEYCLKTAGIVVLYTQKMEERGMSEFRKSLFVFLMSASLAIVLSLGFFPPANSEDVWATVNVGAIVGLVSVLIDRFWFRE